MAAADFVFFLAFDVGGSRYLAQHQNTFDFLHNNVLIMENVFHELSIHKTPFIFASSQMSNMTYSPYGTAKAIGEYNAQVNRQQAAFWDAKAKQQRAAYLQIDKPRLEKKQRRDRSNFFVNTLMTGAEFSGTNYAMMLAFDYEQGTDLVIADYNESIEFM